MQYIPIKIFVDKFIEDFFNLLPKIVNGHTIDLSCLEFMHPWAIGASCLFLIERQQFRDKNIILPTNKNLLCYLKRMHFDEQLKELDYMDAATILAKISISENENLNVHEIIHCRYADEFSARLGRFERMFRNFGLNDEDAKRALVIFGELGNNVFDHNLGNWPTNFSGSIVVAQNYPQKKRIECVIADAGVGFLGSLRAAFPTLDGDIEAIRKGLEGYTGRIGESRGNGLKTIQNWTVNKFHGIVNIHSGKGLIQVDQDGIQTREVIPTLGTMAQFVLYYQ